MMKKALGGGVGVETYMSPKESFFIFPEGGGGGRIHGNSIKKNIFAATCLVYRRKICYIVLLFSLLLMAQYGPQK